MASPPARRRSGSSLRVAAVVISVITAMLAALPAQAGATSAGTEATLQPLVQRSVTVDGVERDYWVYVPEDYAEYRLDDPKDNPLVVVLHPDGMDGESYAYRTPWARLAEERNFIAVFPSASGGSWNASRDTSGPDDVQFVEGVTDAARGEWKSSLAFTYLVGEGSGAAVATTVAATRADKYVGVASLGGAAPRSLWNDATAGLDATNMATWQVIVGSGMSPDEGSQIDYWKDQNGVAGPTTGARGFGYGRTSVDKNPDNPLAQVRVTHVKKAAALRSQAVAETIYDRIFRSTLRFADHDSTNGSLVGFQSAQDLGLDDFRGTFGDSERRWYVYVPKKYAKLTRRGAELPVVMVFHGRNGSARWVAQQTQWADVAEDRGFIAVFPQADLPSGNDPTANFGFSASLSLDNTDVAFTLGILEDLEQRFAVDSGRVFLTGVSQGAAFTNRLAVQYPERFAAIAPCYSGHLRASNYQDTTVVRRDIPIPVWQCAGENEQPFQFPGGTAGEAAARTFWRETVNQNVGPAELQVDGRYTTEIFSDGLAEYRWTTMGDIGHFMSRNLSYKIWDELFDRYERLPDGSLVQR
jgi:poly(3-hydroxybutyrate) depolymerase